MKNLIQLKALPLFVLALCMSVFAVAQDQKPVASPADSVTAKAGKATITIKYSSPSVKERKIWGGLVPYDQVWRAGANKATTFTTNKDIKVEGKTLAAGTYSFFVIPTNDDWTVIFNKTADQWGAYKYEEKEDALRVKVKPVKSASKNERLQYAVNAKGFTLSWDELTLPVSIK